MIKTSRIYHINKHHRNVRVKNAIITVTLLVYKFEEQSVARSGRFFRVPEGEHVSCNAGTHVLPDMFTITLGNHAYICYNYYISLTTDYIYEIQLGKFFDLRYERGICIIKCHHELILHDAEVKLRQSLVSGISMSAGEV